MDNRPIGIFDSGIGGLTVLKAIREKLPYEDIIYLGDTARVPYGNKSRDTIIRFSTDNSLFLLSLDVKAIVVACNTASALALDYLEKYFNVPLLGVITPGADKAVNITTSGKIGVIGTKATIKSKSYQKAILSRRPDALVYNKSCPLFVPLVEERLTKGIILDEIVQMYLKGFKKEKIDTLILGCTHYPILKTAISSYLDNIKIVDSGCEVANSLKVLLNERKIAFKNKRKSKTVFYVTDDPKGFCISAEDFFGEKINKPYKIDI